MLCIWDVNISENGRMGVVVRRRIQRCECMHKNMLYNAVRMDSYFKCVCLCSSLVVVTLVHISQRDQVTM